MTFKMPKRLPHIQPISANGVRLKRGDIVDIIDKDKVCSCNVCSRVKQQNVIRVMMTQDEDPWLYANEAQNGEHPLIRLSKPNGQHTSCCFRASALNFVSRDGCRDKPSELRIEVSATKQAFDTGTCKPSEYASRTLFKQPDESYADFGRRIAETIAKVEHELKEGVR